VCAFTTGLENDQRLKELKRPGKDAQGRDLSPSDKARDRQARDPQAPGTGTADQVQVRITADHRACADLFAVYMYNIYRRQEMAKIWTNLAAAYDTVLKNFVSLLEKNSSLKPMVHFLCCSDVSVLAQVLAGHRTLIH
jgi:hypothetical protein